MNFGTYIHGPQMMNPYHICDLPALPWEPDVGQSFHVLNEIS